MTLFIAAALGVVLGGQPSVAEFEPRGYIVEASFEIAADPAVVYDAATGDISPWWDHNFASGYGETLHEFVIEPRAGGRFVERFGEGAEVLHATVIYARPGEALRFDGPLGFSGLAAQFVVTYELAGIETGTRFDVTVNASGQIDDDGAAALARVWEHFIGGRLKPYVEAGCHEAPDEPCEAFLTAD